MFFYLDKLCYQGIAIAFKICYIETMKKVIKLTKECNNPKIEEFIKFQILPKTKRYQHVEFSSAEREEGIIDENTTTVISKTITLNSIQDQNFSNICFKNCLFNKENTPEKPCDISPLVPINAILKNCSFVNCSLQDLNLMTLENCTFVNCNFARLYDVGFNGSSFQNCIFLKINNEETSRNLDFSNCSFERCLIDRVFGCKFDNVDFTKHGALGVLYNYNEKLHYPGLKNYMRFPIGYSSVLLPTAMTNSYESYSFKGAKISKNDFLVMSKIWAPNGLGKVSIKFQTKEGKTIPVTEDSLPLPLIGPLTQGYFVVKELGKENFVPIIEYDFQEKSRDFIVVDTEKHQRKKTNITNKEDDENFII